MGVVVVVGDVLITAERLTCSSIVFTIVVPNADCIVFLSGSQ